MRQENVNLNNSKLVLCFFYFCFNSPRLELKTQLNGQKGNKRLEQFTVIAGEEWTGHPGIVKKNNKTINVFLKTCILVFIFLNLKLPWRNLVHYKMPEAFTLENTMNTNSIISLVIHVFLSFFHELNQASTISLFEIIISLRSETYSSLCWENINEFLCHPVVLCVL